METLLGQEVVAMKLRRRKEPRRGSDGAHPRSVADKSKRAAPREPTLARGFFLSEQTKAGSSLALPLQRV
jgi:hypothetical protein